MHLSLLAGIWWWNPTGSIIPWHVCFTPRDFGARYRIMCAWLELFNSPILRLCASYFPSLTFPPLLSVAWFALQVHKINESLFGWISAALALMLTSDVRVKTSALDWYCTHSDWIWKLIRCLIINPTCPSYRQLPVLLASLINRNVVDMVPSPMECRGQNQSPGSFPLEEAVLKVDGRPRHY
jgi:hypothetical protein